MEEKNVMQWRKKCFFLYHAVWETTKLGCCGIHTVHSRKCLFIPKHVPQSKEVG